jgi:hypothetical protein
MSLMIRLETLEKKLKMQENKEQLTKIKYRDSLGNERFLTIQELHDHFFGEIPADQIDRALKGFLA